MFRRALRSGSVSSTGRRSSFRSPIDGASRKPGSVAVSRVLRARLRAAGDPAPGVMICHEMSCFVPAGPGSAPPPRRPASIGPVVSFIASPSVCAAAGFPAAGPCFARIPRAYAPGRARLCAGAVRAPDCAREPQGAPFPSAHAGGFFGPQLLLPCAEKPKGDPGRRLSVRAFIHPFARSQAFLGLISRNVPHGYREPASGAGPGRRFFRLVRRRRAARLRLCGTIRGALGIP